MFCLVVVLGCVGSCGIVGVVCVLYSGVVLVGVGGVLGFGVFFFWCVLFCCVFGGCGCGCNGLVF